MLTELMLTQPDELLTGAGMAMTALEQLQNQSSLWESLLAVPQLLTSTSLEQLMDSAEALLSSMQR